MSASTWESRMAERSAARTHRTEAELAAEIEAERTAALAKLQPQIDAYIDGLDDSTPADYEGFACACPGSPLRGKWAPCFCALRRMRWERDGLLRD